jgi:hypothetical protein
MGAAGLGVLQNTILVPFAFQCRCHLGSHVTQQCARLQHEILTTNCNDGQLSKRLCQSHLTEGICTTMAWLVSFR